VKARLAAVLLVVLAAGCSALGFAYNNADTWLRWKADHYLDLEKAQAGEFDVRLTAFVSWHRSQALPRYARLAEEAGARLERGATRDDLVWGYDVLREEAREALRQAGTGLGDFLDRLTPAQIEGLEQRFAEDNRKYAERWLAGTPAERRARRFKRLVHELQDWLGELSDVQRERVREFSERAPLNAELRDRERRRLQAELLAMLRARSSASRLADWAAHWDRGREPEFAVANQAYVEDMFTMLAGLERSLSADQRRHVVRRLRGYARDFQVLTAAR
jgi:hypothetical protein